MQLKRIGMAVASAAVVTALATGPAFAAGSTYNLSYGGGAHAASGGATWLNRSVTIQGSVTDIGGAGTQVEFDSWAGSNLTDVQTRTAINEVKSYNFTLDGSAWVGGITEVDVYLWDLHTNSIVDSAVLLRP